MPLEAERTLKAERGPPRGGAGELRAFLAAHARIAVLTGAGCSTRSGIPDYRDENGAWRYRQPMTFAEFTGSPAARRRYWAQSFAGWRRIDGAAPNAAHAALARLEAQGRAAGIITQNVDDLHRRAGSRRVIDLHGVLRRVRCLGCGALSPRAAFQARLAAANPGWHATVSAFAPDGDARLEDALIDAFCVPDCEACGGMLKPDVVFFGESVPAARVTAATALVRSADALLVVGSSLMVLSGFRFARAAYEAGIALALLNRGVTRADALATHRFEGDCTALLDAAVDP
jgi:NAD-dependent SIR2 family protein deacetylase